MQFPTTGRFLSRDPIGDGRNWYAYCANNPVTRADANGLAKIRVYNTGVHTYIMVIDEAGAPLWAISARPKDGYSPFVRKPIKFDSGPFQVGHPDYREGWDTDQPYREVLDDDKPGKRWQDWLDKLAKKLESDAVTYSLFGPNSNTAMSALLEMIGYPMKNAPGIAPGWSMKWPGKSRPTVRHLDCGPITNRGRYPTRPEFRHLK